MKRNVFLLGADTHLGSWFRMRCLEQGDRVREFNPSSGNYCRELKAPTQIDEEYDWIVNCSGRNRLAVIGKDEWQDASIHGIFTNSILVENVAPIYWVVNDLVARGHPPARVLSVASQTYRIAQTHTAMYCASKAALVQLSKVMARELAPKGWVINCLAPGKIEDTRMSQLTDRQVRELRGWTDDEANAYALRNIPMGRFTTREEVVRAMMQILLLPEYINGTCIDMTGGA